MRKVFIRVGHGGKDPGAIGNGLKEKDINLTVALKLKELLLEHGFQVLLSRETDIETSLSADSSKANEWKADLALDIHHNAGGGDGWEIIHSIHQKFGKELAEKIGEEFTKLGQNKRRIFTRVNPTGDDFFGFIRMTNMESLITEFAFIDSPDHQIIDSVGEQYAEAKAIAKAICSFYGVDFREYPSDLSEWAKAGYDFVRANHISDGTRPKGHVTREEAWEMLRRATLLN